MNKVHLMTKLSLNIAQDLKFEIYQRKLCDNVRHFKLKWLYSFTSERQEFKALPTEVPFLQP
jgi:hypothetical protein